MNLKKLFTVLFLATTFGFDISATETPKKIKLIRKKSGSYETINNVADKRNNPIPKGNLESLPEGIYKYKASKLLFGLGNGNIYVKDSEVFHVHIKNPNNLLDSNENAVIRGPIVTKGNTVTDWKTKTNPSFKKIIEGFHKQEEEGKKKHNKTTEPSVQNANSANNNDDSNNSGTSKTTTTWGDHFLTPSNWCDYGTAGTLTASFICAFIKGRKIAREKKMYKHPFDIADFAAGYAFRNCLNPKVSKPAIATYVLGALYIGGKFIPGIKDSWFNKNPF